MPTEATGVLKDTQQEALGGGEASSARLKPQMSIFILRLSRGVILSSLPLPLSSRIWEVWKQARNMADPCLMSTSARWKPCASRLVSRPTRNLSRENSCITDGRHAAGSSNRGGTLPPAPSRSFLLLLSSTVGRLGPLRLCIASCMHARPLSTEADERRPC